MSATAGSTAPIYASMFTSGISAVGTGIAQSRAVDAKGVYDESVANTNAELSRLQAKQAISAGDAEVARRDEENKIRTGAARAGAGASGADIGSFSTSLAIKSISDVNAMDVQTIKNNAARTAWGFQTQAIIDRFRGNMARLTSKAQSEQTLITGGLKAIAGPLSIYSDYVRYNQRYNGKQATPNAGSGDSSGTDDAWEMMP